MPKKFRVNCIRCGEEMSLLKSIKQKFMYNQSFCMDPSISASQVFCDQCMYDLYKRLVYRVVDFLNESREIRTGQIKTGEMKKGENRNDQSF